MNMRVRRSANDVPFALEQMPRIDLVLPDLQLPDEDGSALPENIPHVDDFQETRRLIRNLIHWSFRVYSAHADVDRGGSATPDELQKGDRGPGDAKADNSQRSRFKNLILVSGPSLGTKGVSL